MIENPIKMVCDTCGSEDVSKDAWAEWNTDTQEWELQSTFDDTYCHSCETEHKLVEEPLT